MLARRLSTLVAIALAGCGGGGGDGGGASGGPPTAPPAAIDPNQTPIGIDDDPPPLPGLVGACPIADSPPASGTGPAMEISFPLSHAGYDREAIGVSGRLDHPEPEEITVSACVGDFGISDSPRDDGRFSIGGLPVPTNGSSVTILVEAEHSDGSATRQALTLARTTLLSHVPSLVHDPVGNQLLGVDTPGGAIIAIPDAGPGYEPELIVAQPFSLPITPILSEPIAITRDTEANDYYVLDNELNGIVRIDPDSRSLTVVTDEDTGTGERFLRPTDIEWDASRQRIVVSDDGRRSIIAVDPDNGDRTALSSIDVGTGPSGFFHRAMGIDGLRDRVLILGSGLDIHAVDLSSGDRSLFSGAANDAPDVSRDFTGIAVDSAGGVAYLTDSFSNAVVTLNLITGDRQSISSSGLVTASPLISHPVVGAGPALEWPMDAAFDPSTNRLFVTETDFADSLIEIDLVTGDRTLLHEARLGTGISFRRLDGLFLDVDNGLAYVADNVADSIASIDLATGNRNLIEGPADGRGTIDNEPVAIAVDPAAETAYVIDFQLDSLYALDLASSTRTTISDPSRGIGPAFIAPVDIELDLARNLAYVVDVGLDELLSVDLASGDRISLGEAAEGMTLDAGNDLLYVVDRSGDEIIEIDLTSNSRRTVTGGGTGVGQSFSSAADVALDTLNNRLIVVDASRGTLVEVDIATGDRAILSGDSSLLLLQDGDLVWLRRSEGGGPPLAGARHIAIDSERQIAYLTDAAYQALVAVDLGTGYRQIIAK